MFAKSIAAKSASLAAVISGDLSPALNLANSADQQRVIVAIGSTQQDLSNGLSNASSWAALQSIKEALDPDARKKLSDAIDAARSQTILAQELRAKGVQDVKFRLKVMAAQWHEAHHSGLINDCPLCTQTLKDQTSLANELEALRALGGEPLALNGQYLIVGQELDGASALESCDGMPVIAADSDDKKFFKRLRISSDRIVLESLDSGGDYGPIVMQPPGHQENSLQKVWPVVGVLFELPN